jgi:prepilin-type N-terminal cleavage/methylation domain-containing protein
MLLFEKKKKKRWQRGLMLVEVLVVVAIMAIISTIVAFAVIPLYVDHQKKVARQSASSLRLIIGTWRMSHYGEDCPRSRACGPTRSSTANPATTTRGALRT